MGKPVQDDDEPLELPLPPRDDDEPEAALDSDEFALSELGEGSEEVGLDAETGVVDLLDELEADDAEEDSFRDDDTLDEGIAEVDAEGDENGWIEESDGLPEVFEGDFFEGEDEDEDDDGGLEGVDDSLLEGIGEDEAEHELGGDGDEIAGDSGDDSSREHARNP